MPAPRDTALLVRAARLYYEEDFSQADVARTLGISRSNVSRILARARDQGIVTIRISDPEAAPARVGDLERILIERFHLDDAIVASDSGEPAIDAVGRSGAELVEHLDAQSFGLSWGHTLQTLVSHMEPRGTRQNIDVLPLVGGVSGLDTLDSGDTLLRVFASRLGAKPTPLYAPALLESATAYSAFMGESSIASVLERAGGVDVALIGIGSKGKHSSTQILRAMKLTDDEIAAFEAQQPVGDLCGRYFTADGAEIGPPTSERVISVTFDQLRRIPTTVGLAAGTEKAPGVLGALNTGLLNVVVLDVALAQAVLGMV